MPLLLVLSLACFSSALVIRLTDPLVTEIARDFSADPGTVALLASAFAFPYALGQPILGPLADTIGKARVIKACLAIVAAGMLAAALAPSLDLLFLGRALAGLAAGGVIPVSLALIGDRFELHERQVALSRLLGAMRTGQLIGAIGAGTIGAAAGWRTVLGVGTGLVALALVLTLVQLVPRAEVERPAFSLARIRDAYAQVFANPRARICYTAVFVEGVCIIGILPYLSVLLERRGTGGVTEAGIVLAGLGSGGVLFTLLVPWLLRRLGGPMNLMRAGGAIAGAGLFCYALSPGVVSETLSFLVVGVGFYMLHNSLQTQATELAPGARGAAVALHASFFFAGQATGPIAYRFGFAWLGTLAPILLAAAAMAALGFWTAARLSAKHREP